MNKIINKYYLISPMSVTTIKNMINTIKLARKSDKEDYIQHFRLVLLGISTIGMIGFIIQFVFSVIQLDR